MRLYSCISWSAGYAGGEIHKSYLVRTIGLYTITMHPLAEQEYREKVYWQYKTQ